MSQANHQEIDREPGAGSSTPGTRATLDTFLKRMGGGDVAGVVELFADDASWDVPGDVANVPWLGKRERQQIHGFFATMAEHTVREAFDIHHTVVDGDNAVIVGRARLAFTPAGTTIDTPFAIHIVVDPDSRIMRFAMFEDSWSVALAARPELSDVPARSGPPEPVQPVTAGQH